MFKGKFEAYVYNLNEVDKRLIGNDIKMNGRKRKSKPREYSLLQENLTKRLKSLSTSPKTKNYMNNNNNNKHTNNYFSEIEGLDENDL